MSWILVLLFWTTYIIRKLYSCDAQLLHTCTLSQVQGLVLLHHDHQHETLPHFSQYKSLAKPSLLCLGSYSGLGKRCSVPNTAESADFDRKNGSWISTKENLVAITNNDVTWAYSSCRVHDKMTLSLGLLFWICVCGTGQVCCKSEGFFWEILTIKSVFTEPEVYFQSLLWKCCDFTFIHWFSSKVYEPCLQVSIFHLWWRHCMRSSINSFHNGCHFKDM